MKYKTYIASCDDDGGIYCYDFEDGHLVLDEVVKIPRPMYMAFSEGKMHVISSGKNQGEGSYVVYDVVDGRLVNPSSPVPTLGQEPCHLCSDKGETYIVNYISGNVVKFPAGKVVAHEGKGTNARRQDKAHTHMACFSPARRRVFVTDLGLDTVFVYDRNLDYVSKARVPDGYGARHLALSPDGKYVYCVNELVSSVTVFAYERGVLEPLETYECPVDFDGVNTAAAIRLNKAGNLLCISNRGENTLVFFDVEGAKLKFRQKIGCTGNFPRDFDFAPDEDFIICCNQLSNNVTVFSFENGEARFFYSVTGVKNPLCVLTLPV